MILSLDNYFCSIGLQSQSIVRPSITVLAMTPESPKPSVLAADYQSDKETVEFKHSLDAVAPDAPTVQRINYLASLRSSVATLQEEINAFLTKKMEEDKAHSAKLQDLDDRREEENYGEEVVEGS